MIPPVRFGNVVVLFDLDKDEAQKLKTPGNRVIVQNNYQKPVYLVTGQEDIQTVDDVMTLHKQAQQEKRENTARLLTDGLWRFLAGKGLRLKTKREDTCYGTLEVL